VQEIVFGLYSTVTEQLVPVGTDSAQVVEETVAVPGDGVIVPETAAATFAALKARGESPSLVKVAVTE
jgi:hypothetical protein